jgi:DNA invertase Pin-like site-specific DNA recombinase
MLPRAGLNMLASIVDVFHFRGFIGFMVRAAIYYRRPADSTDWDPSQDLRQAVERRGGTVVATHTDDDGSTVRARNAGWKSLLANLGEIDEVIVASAGDLPGRNIRSLLRALGALRDHGVSLHFHREGISSQDSSFALLDIAGAWQRAKLSKAIKIGQARAVEAGKVVGRPAIPHGVVVAIQRSLAGGAGIRWTARRFKVSPGSIVNIRRSMTTGAGVEAG